MSGIKKLRKIQLGRETTAGSECNATALWRGTGTIQDNLEIVFPDEDVGYMSGVDRSYIPKTEGLLELDETPCTYEQVLHILEMGVMTATPSTAGGGNAYTYTFPTTAAATTKTYTVEAGNNQQEEQFVYGFCPSFNLSGSAGEAVMMSASIVGRQVAPGTYTTGVGVTTATVEEVLFGKGILGIDATSGAHGGTPQTSTFLDFNLDVDTGWRAVYTGDGAIYFTFPKNVGPEITLDVTFEHDTFGVAQVAAWRAQTAKLVQVKFTGATLTTTGSTYTTKNLIINLAGKWESFDKIGERDGNDIVTGTLRARYNATSTKFAEIIVVNNAASVP